VIVDQKGCEFLPYVIAVPPQGKVLFGNSDPTIHNVHIKPVAEDGRLGKTILNRAQPRKARPMEISLKDPGLHRVECDLHYWMQAWIYVTKAPAAVVTAEDGTFEIGDLPKGTYKLTVLHNRLASRKQTIQVKAGKTVQLTIKVGP
jgi:plastocyanin